MSQIKARRESYMMVGVDLNFGTQGCRAGAKSELVVEEGQQDKRATTSRKKVRDRSYDIGFQYSMSQINATRVSYMTV
jgi:hypothetical protein